MSRLARVICAAILILVIVEGSAPLSAAAEGLSVFIDRVDSEEFPSVSVHLIVIDEKGMPVVGIAPDVVSATEDDKVVISPSLSPLVAADEPLAVTLVIDISQSMAGKPLEDARSAASSFIDDIGPNDMAAIIAFAGQVFGVKDFTSDKKALKDALASLAVGPNTALFDAVAGALEVTQSASADHRVIVLLSDGEDINSKRSLQEVIKSAATARVPIYAIGLGQNIDRKVLQQITYATGGRALYAPSSADLQSTFSALAAQLKSRYVLNFTSQIPADNAQHVMMVAINDRGKKVEGTARFVAIASPPRIVFLSPRATTLTGRSTAIEVKIQSVARIAKVQFSVDGKVISEVTREPFRFVWYRDFLEPGRHVIGTTAIDTAGNSASQEMEVLAPSPASPEANSDVEDPDPVSIESVPEPAAPTWNPYQAIPVASFLLLSLLLVSVRRRRTQTGPKKRGSRLPWPFFTPLCPICGRRYSPQRGCSFCKEQEGKAVSERLQQIFHTDFGRGRHFR